MEMTLNASRYFAIFISDGVKTFIFDFLNPQCQRASRSHFDKYVRIDAAIPELSFPLQV